MLTASGPLDTLDHVDGYPLTFRQIGDAAAIKRRGMHEDVSAAAVPDDEAEPLIGVVPFHRTGLLDGGLIGGSIGTLRSWAPRLVLQRSARVDAEDLGYLQTLLTRRRPDLKRGARRHGAVAAALTTLTWRKASPPVGSCTKPKPFSGLYHFTVAETGGPVGAFSKRGLFSRGPYPEFAGGE
jgi:hypothetical protein